MEVEKLAVLAFSSARDHWSCWEWTLYTLTFHRRIEISNLQISTYTGGGCSEGWRRDAGSQSLGSGPWWREPGNAEKAEGNCMALRKGLGALEPSLSGITYFRCSLADPARDMEFFWIIVSSTQVKINLRSQEFEGQLFGPRGHHTVQIQFVEFTWVLWQVRGQFVVSKLDQLRPLASTPKFSTWLPGPWYL